MAEEPGQDGGVELEEEQEGPQASGVLGSSTPASQVLPWPALVCGQEPGALRSRELKARAWPLASVDSKGLIGEGARGELMKSIIAGGSCFF